MNRLRKGNKTMEIAFHVLSVVEVVQTLGMAGKNGRREGNPLFGPRPNPAVFIGAKAAWSGLHYLMYLGRRDNPKEARQFELLSLGMQSGFVMWNMKAMF